MATLLVDPANLQFKLTHDDDLDGIVGGDWDIERRVLITETPKFRSILAHFVHGSPWENTELFAMYAERIARGERVRSCKSMAELKEQYDTKVDAMFRLMRARGFAEKINGRVVPLPHAHIDRAGRVVGGTQGNHRVSIAKILELSEIPVLLRARHASLCRPDWPKVVEDAASVA
jgi:hypothetical protein